ncbi:MAG: SpoIIE family protein phosphatase [Bacteroidota bacterium]|nr:SpoIIE family protein phosphatase [Bacteroidota bacterium]
MTTFLDRMNIYRILLGLLLSFLLILSAVTFYSFISTPTDENVFRNPLSNLMVVKNFSAEMHGKRVVQSTRSLPITSTLDSIITGDLIISINNGTVKTMKDVARALDEGPQNDIRFEVLRPSTNNILLFKTKRSLLKTEFLVFLPSHVLVTDVTVGGASDRAGMKIGDLILRINEQEFKTDVEADRILRLGQIGKSLKYEILRNNRFVELNVELAKFGIPISILIFCLAGVLWMCIGGFIIISRPNIIAARLIGSSFLFVGFFMTVLIVRRDVDSTPFIIIRNIIMNGGFVFGVSAMFHSFHYFPLERTDLIDKKWIIPGYYITAIVSSLISYVVNSPFPLALLLIYGIYISIRYRKGISLEYKRLNRVNKWTSLIVGVTMSIIGFFFTNILQVIVVGAMGLILSAIPLSYLFTIGRYRLLDLNFRVRRNTQYSIVTIIWGIIVFYILTWTFFKLPMLELPQANIVFTGTAIEINDTPALASEREASEHVMLMVIAIGLTFVVLRVRKVGQQLIDKKYYRQQYDYRRASLELGEILATTLTMDDLARGLVRKLSELMKLKRVGVLFFREEKNCSCLSAYGFDGKVWEEFCISHERELITSIHQFKNEFRIDYLPTLLKDEFHREGFHYGVPIRSKEKLIGVLLVGEKQSETTFRQEDLAFLSTTAKQASVAIENAFLYEELAEKERMKHELQIARRIQLDSLPQTTPEIQGLEISGTSIPAMEVGGDFFDYLSNGNGALTVVIGDVSGKGTSAALYMSKVQGILRSLHGFDLSPKELFQRANKLLCQDLEKRSFVTVLGVEFDPKKRSAIVSRAGHLPLWHYEFKSKTVKKILPRGLGLGLNNASVFTAEMKEKKTQYEKGDVFLFATDGVTEAHNTGGDFGEERLQNILSDNAEKSAQEIQTIILHELSSFVGNQEQHDDQTVVVVKAV